MNTFTYIHFDDLPLRYYSFKSTPSSLLSWGADEHMGISSLGVSQWLELYKLTVL